MPNKIHYLTVLYKLGITQTEAAKRIGCTRPYLNAVINGHLTSARINYHFQTWAKGDTVQAKGEK